MLLVLCLGWGDLLFALPYLSLVITTRRAEGFNPHGKSVRPYSILPTQWCTIGPRYKQWTIINPSNARGCTGDLQRRAAGRETFAPVVSSNK